MRIHGILGFSVGAVLCKLMGTQVVLFCLSVSKNGTLCRIHHRPFGVSVESLCETPGVGEKRKGVKMVEIKGHWRHNISIWNMLMSSDMGEIW